jgi:hypothetical protein
VLLVEVVVHPEVSDLLLAHHPSQRVPELGLLDEQVLLGMEAGRDLRGLEVEAEPLLDAAEPGASGKVSARLYLCEERGSAVLRHEASARSTFTTASARSVPVASSVSCRFR